MRLRKEDNYIYLDADVYQAAILNVQLPFGIRIEQEHSVLKQMQTKEKKKEKLLKEQ